MRIKSLDIHGFKSFADRGHFEFGQGITGIVGPNGCGKSNIIDALRWVMGEMSAKHLRGRGMQDVIFAGSDSRGPAGMAEVTLTLHNDGDAPPQFADFSEIGITRRLHRDGTSEYLINKIPSRLRDITDLFLGTGVGTRAYSIIEQGRIGFIVSSRPEDRRTLIEEVAGITKFKARRKAAERRMTATEQNLARVNDIVGELERQLASLRRQAKKAERYKRIKEELRDIDLHVASMKFLELSAMEKVRRGELRDLDRRSNDTHAGISTQETHLEADRIAQIEAEQALQAQQKANAQIEAQLAALERDLTHFKQQILHAKEQVVRATEEVQVSQQRLDQSHADREETQTQLTAVASLASGAKEALHQATTAVQQGQQCLLRTEEQIEALRRDAVEHVHELARQRTLIDSIQKQRTEAQGRLERANTERVSLENSVVTLKDREELLLRRHDDLKGELTTWQQQAKEVRGQFDETTAALTQSDKTIRAKQTDLTERVSRRDSLEAIAKRFEGFSDGVRSLMRPESKQHQGPAIEGIESVISDIIETPPRYERAVEAALGERLQYLIVQDFEVAKRAVDFLKSRNGGRSGFVKRQSGDTSKPLPPHPKGDGILGRASDLCRLPACDAEMGCLLLGRVIIVSDLNTALLHAGQDPHALTWVTLDGEVVDPTGALIGGSTDGAGLLAQAREIRELNEQCQTLQQSIDAAQKEHQALEVIHLQHEVDLQQIDKDMRTGELEALEVDKDRQATSDERSRLADRLEVMHYDATQAQSDLGRMDQEATQATQAAEVAQTAKASLEEQLEALRLQRTEQSKGSATSQEALTTLQIESATNDEKQSALHHRFELLNQAVIEHSDRIKSGTATIAKNEARIIDLDQKIMEGAQLAQQTATTADQMRQTVQQMRRAYDDKRENLTDMEQTLRSDRRGYESVQESLVQLKMNLQRLELDQIKLIEQVAERHDVPLLTVVSDYHLRPPPGPKELEHRGKLESSLSNIGSINLTAIEECAEVEKRYTFLTEQRDDLTAALESLRRAILRINRTSRQRFRQAFDAVNTMFEKLFPRLFRGGEARLELLPHDDILEAGVDIVAQPPGKKLQNVGLLSGGEKALTATALVFSIFLIKPSPFCVLDEVDAPLDDQNVTRFNELLREISKISQFIVISHNKLTMAEADRLYGVTMEDPGMSKLVSVDFNRADSDAAA